MVSLSRTMFVALPCLLAFGCVASPAARADTYVVYNLGEANPFGIYGIDTAGTVVIRGVSAATCGTNMSFVTCYYTWTNGVNTAQSTAAPTLNYDNGTSCTIAGVPGGATGTCNSGKEAYFNRFDTPRVAGLFNGPDPLTDLIAESDSADRIFLNAVGDVAWTDGARETNYEAVDVSAPEPASLALLGTGALGAVGVVRRRYGRGL